MNDADSTRRREYPGDFDRDRAVDRAKQRQVHTVVAQQMTPRVARLPVDERGYPIPWFVAELPDGTRDFRVADGRKRHMAVKLGLCWICGEPLGSFKAFVIGPMCAINRVSADPPMHLECAQFSVAVCPFLTKPKAKRREAGMPDDLNSGGGFAIKRNPGVSLLWVTRSFSVVNDDTGGWILRVGEPTQVEWYAEGRAATRDEVLASIESGYPLLHDVAEKEGPRAIRALEQMRESATKLLPAGVGGAHP